jgi:UrcA family protein
MAREKQERGELRKRNMHRSPERIGGWSGRRVFCRRNEGGWSSAGGQRVLIQQYTRGLARPAGRATKEPKMPRIPARNRFATLAATALGASLLAVAAAPAAMAAATEAKVSFADLDLTTEAGRAALSARVDRAARSVCTSQVETGTILRRRADSTCVARIKSQIERQLAERMNDDRLGG